MGEAPETPAFGADERRKHFAEVYPDHGALRKGEGGDESYQQPHQKFGMTSPCEDGGASPETNGGTNSSRQQELLPPDSVNQTHGCKREREVSRADQDCLRIA